MKLPRASSKLIGSSAKSRNLGGREGELPQYQDYYQWTRHYGSTRIDERLPDVHQPRLQASLKPDYELIKASSDKTQVHAQAFEILLFNEYTVQIADFQSKIWRVWVSTSDNI
ncbi:hypothetical protein N7523_008092 [Penicillium sp. IBT 18751x]|nr:hypothetical protein N7523_008092 [Penicillium sp. IBT 18751x]